MPSPKRTATGVLGGIAGLVGLSAIAGVLVTATVTPAIALTSNAASSAITMFDNLPSYLDIDELMLPTTIYAKDGDSDDYVELTQFYDQNRSPVEWDDVTPVMYDAILSSEDPRYYSHGGVDLIGTTRAVLSNLQGNDTQGGSSISQQYVKNVLIQRCERDAPTDEELLNCWTQATTASGTVGIERKVQEMRYAIALEQRYSKNDILLGYLNIANFGGQNYGIDAAARYYFDVSASKLSLAQAATLAGIVQNPNTYRIDLKGGSTTNSDGDPVNSAEDGYALTKERQSYVLGRMLDDGKITQEQYDEAIEAPIEPNITQPATGCGAAGGAAYFCQYVKGIIETDEAFGATRDDRENELRRGGLNIYTTLDFRIQNEAQAAMKEWTPTKVDGMDFGAASVSIEVGTGRVLAIAQNTKFSEDASLTTGENRDKAYSSLVYAGDFDIGGATGFSAGSSWKLFTLVDWLEQGHSVREVLNGRVRAIDRLTNSCAGDWVNFENDTINNFANAGGYTATPMEFTRDSLNSGYLAMAEELDLCDIQNVAAKMGVETAQWNNDDEAWEMAAPQMNTAFSVLGSENVSPLRVAGAYGTVANNGIYCEPKFIDRVTDAEGNGIDPPETSCSQVLSPEVAATAAFALQGVMQPGGTGSASNPYDGVPLIGKTGTHEKWQTWMNASSTEVATSVWVGNSLGETDLYTRWHNGVQLSQLRHQIAPRIIAAANAAYGGEAFPQPDSNLTRQVLRDLPSVVGMSVDDATRTLQAAGFSVRVGDAVNSTEAEGVVARQDPGAGRVAGGTAVTIYPSNGNGVTVPDVIGQDPQSAAQQLRSAGFGRVGTQCEQSDDAPPGGVVTRLDPAAGSEVTQNTRITITYSADNCGGGGGNGNGNGNDDDD